MTRALFVLLLAAAAPLASEGQTPLAGPDPDHVDPDHISPEPARRDARPDCSAPNTTSSISGSGRGP